MGSLEEVRRGRGNIALCRAVGVRLDVQTVVTAPRPCPLVGVVIETRGDNEVDLLATVHNRQQIQRILPPKHLDVTVFRISEPQFGCVCPHRVNVAVDVGRNRAAHAVVNAASPKRHTADLAIAVSLSVLGRR